MTKQKPHIYFITLKEFFVFRNTADLISPEAITLPEAWDLTWSWQWTTTPADKLSISSYI